jgi:hypothetical protein
MDYAEPAVYLWSNVSWMEKMIMQRHDAACGAGGVVRICAFRRGFVNELETRTEFETFTDTYDRQMN